MANVRRALARTLLSLPSPILRLMSGGAAVYRGGRTLDPRFQFMAAQAARMPAMTSLSPEEARRATAEGGKVYGGRPEPGVRVEPLTIPAGERSIAARLYRPQQQDPAAPAIVFAHFGGGVIGDLDTSHAFCGILAKVTRAPVVSVEYRLAPEHPHPAPIDDCHAGIVWLARHARELGIDPDRIIVMGVSAGAGLAAGIALLARDRGFPTLSHQVLLRPMLDDRMRTHSSQMLDGEGVWDRNENAFGWAALLGRQSEVSPYAAPSRAVDLSGLPRTYLDTGSADTFRDETLEYAGRLSAHGVSVDLHVWGGGFHGFENQVPDAALSRICRTVQDEFIRRALAPARQAKG